MNLFGTICVAVKLEVENLAASAFEANNSDQRRDFILDTGRVSRRQSTEDDRILYGTCQDGTNPPVGARVGYRIGVR